MTNDEALDPGDLLAQARAALMDRSDPLPTVREIGAFRKAERLARSRKPMRCPFCGGSGAQVAAFSTLWGHNCWICAGWGVVRTGKQCLRGPFAPHPSRQNF